MQSCPPGPINLCPVLSCPSTITVQMVYICRSLFQYCYKCSGFLSAFSSGTKFYLLLSHLATLGDGTILLFHWMIGHFSYSLFRAGSCFASISSRSYACNSAETITTRSHMQSLVQTVAPFSRYRDSFRLHFLLFSESPRKLNTF